MSAPGQGGPIALVAGLVLSVPLGLLVLAGAVLADDSDSTATTSTAAGPVQSAVASTSFPATFTAGNIISDQVFYNPDAMTEQQVRDFITIRGAACTGPWCLKKLRVTAPEVPGNRYCTAISGGPNVDAAAVIWAASHACGVNPRVMLTTLQKESQLIDRTDPTTGTYTAAFGWHCPDTGPGGTAQCDPTHAGFVNQTNGMAQQWTRYRLDPDRYQFRAGQTAEILYNVAESGCGSSPVTIANTATAALYNYTPYQPNPASLTNYPGEGDRCSSYGNRNFRHLFHTYFDTGGTATAPIAQNVPPSAGAGTAITLPDDPNVAPAARGKTIYAANASVARGIRAGLAYLGYPYVWGGGGDGAGPNDGCTRGGGAYNSCQGLTGFDCSGLTAYLIVHTGQPTPGGDSTTQRSNGQPIPWDQAQAGDIAGFPEHVAVYLGTIADERYLLEASWIGTPIHIVALTRQDVDPNLRRFRTP